MPNSDHDRNLLFGILAVQMDFISRDQLVAAMNAWVLAKHKPLGEILLEQGALAAERRTLLDALVGEHLKLHANDPEQSLAAVSSVDALADVLARINDPDLHASLAHLAPTGVADPYMTQAPSASLLTGGSLRFATQDPSGSAVTAGSSRFAIVRPHARGGLGEVFVAQDKELHREVALKQIQKRHADNPQSRLRFMQEAEITGGLEHPGIVPVYGLGNYADGRPYYAMRFIRGDSLKDAIERFHAPRDKPQDPAERAVELRGLLGRLIDVCNAIDYAHSRGILHRDLKPGNIMLGKYGETLVVDWGLAKPVDQPESPEIAAESALKPSGVSGSAPTQMGSAVGTPQFMSPEQAAGRIDLVGPASDVYSLGATLYSVLTGKAAFEQHDLGLLLQHVARGEFPPPRAIVRDVPRPLDAICLKAMAVRQEERYATPRALVDDLEHWLADEPVTAYRETLGERAGRWTRRHRAWTQAGATAVVTVAAVAIVASVLISRSWRNEAQAHREAAQGFQEARDAVNDFFTQVSESKLLGVPGLQPLRKDLLTSALTYYQGFLKEHSGDPSLQGELALTGYRVALIENELGQHAKALAELQQAVPVQEQLAKQNPASVAAQQELADSYNQLGNLNQQTVKLSEALTWFQRAADLRQKLVAAHPDDPQLRRKLTNAQNNLAVVEGKLGQVDEARRDYGAANDARAKLVQAHPDTTQYGRDLAQGYYNLGVFERDLEKLPAAREAFGKAVALFEELARKEPRSIDIQRELAETYRVAGDVEARLGKPAAATEFYDKAQALAEKLARQNPFLVQLQADVAAIYLSVGQLQLQTAAPTDALAWFSKARDIQQRLVDDDPTITQFQIDLALAMLNIGAAEQAAGRLVDARTDLEHARAEGKKAVDLAADDSAARDTLARSLISLGRLDQASSKPADALAAYQQALKVYEAGPPSPDARDGQAGCYLNLAFVARAGKQPAEALRLLAEAAKIQAQLVREYPAISRYRRRQAEIVYLSALIYVDQGAWADARYGYEEVQTIREQLVREFPENLDYLRALGTTLDELAEVLWRLNQLKAALAMVQQATAPLRTAVEKAPDSLVYRRSLSAHLAHLATLERKSGQPTAAAAALVDRQKLWAGNADELYGVAGDLALTAAAVGAGAAPLAPQDVAAQRTILDQAIEAFRQAVAAGFDRWDRVHADPRFKILESEPAFKQLLEKGGSSGKAAAAG